MKYTISIFLFFMMSVYSKAQTKISFTQNSSLAQHSEFRIPTKSIGIGINHRSQSLMLTFDMRSLRSSSQRISIFGLTLSNHHRLAGNMKSKLYAGFVFSWYQYAVLYGNFAPYNNRKYPMPVFNYYGPFDLNTFYQRRNYVLIPGLRFEHFFLKNMAFYAELGVGVKMTNTKESKWYSETIDK